MHESLHDPYVAARRRRPTTCPVGDPATGQVALGPIIDRRQLEHIDQLVQDRISAGARLAAGGTSDGLVHRPTVLAEVTPSMPA